MRRCVAVFLISSCAAVNLSAQTSPLPEQTNLARDGAAALPAFAGAERESVFYRIRGMVEDISSFQSRAVKADGLSRMADIIWQQDEQYTRSLFDKALVLTDVAGDDKNSKAFSYLRRDIIARIAKHDADWAVLLIAEALARADEGRGAAERRELNIETAKRLQAEDPKLAAEFASRSLQGGVSPEFVWFLKSLRQRDEASANNLFLGALAQFAQLPAPDPNAFALFGTLYETVYAIRMETPKYSARPPPVAQRRAEPIEPLQVYQDMRDAGERSLSQRKQEWREKYEGRWVSWTGLMEETVSVGAPYASELKLRPVGGQDFEIQVNMDPLLDERLKALRKGQEVRVSGMLWGYYFMPDIIRLSDGALVEVDVPPAQVEDGPR